METKEITSNVVTAVVTAVILGLVGWAMGIFSAGSDALTEQQIKKVIQETLVTDDNLTHAQALSQVNDTLIALDTKVGTLIKDVDDIERSIMDLAGGG